MVTLWSSYPGGQEGSMSPAFIHEEQEGKEVQEEQEGQRCPFSRTIRIFLVNNFPC